MPRQKTRKKRLKHRESEFINCWEEGPELSLPAAGPLSATWLDARREELQALLAAGLITPQEYETLAAEARSTMGDEPRNPCS